MDAFEILIFALIAGSGLIGEILKKRRNRQNTPNTGPNRTRTGEPGHEGAGADELYPAADEAESWGGSPSPWEEGFERRQDSGQGRRSDGRGEPMREPAEDDVFNIDRYLEEALFGRREKAEPAPVRPADNEKGGRSERPAAAGSSADPRSTVGRPGSLERRASLEKGRSLEKEASRESRTLSKGGSRESVRLMGKARLDRSAKKPTSGPALDAPLEVERPAVVATRRGSSPRAWLATPEKVRQAVIASEILGRPKSLQRRNDPKGGVRRP